jgi:large subunit ribosomal protein L21
MYAIVEIAGQQFKVEEGKKIYVHQLEATSDEIIEFDRVLLVEDNDKVLVGEPTVKNYIVEGKIISNVKGDKVIVFKKKRKKGYRVKKGHRQNFSHVEIIGIGEKGTIQRKEAPKKEEVVKEAAPEPVDTTTKKKKPATAKAPDKKPAARKKTVKTEKKSEGVPEKEVKKAEKKTTAKKVSKKKE